MNIEPAFANTRKINLFIQQMISIMQICLNGFLEHTLAVKIEYFELGNSPGHSFSEPV
jgi:hypothetical protein